MLASYYIVHSLIAVYRLAVCSLRLVPVRFNAMSSKSKSKRKNKCSGCGTRKDKHDFAAMGKHCEGPEERDPDSDGNMDHASKFNKPDTCGDVISGTGERKASATQNVTIESFDSWLEAWSIYEALVMDVAPLRYKELARYRDVIQKANRKFVWSAVYYGKP